MNYEDFLNKEIYVKVDRPMGSTHPKYGNIYPVNYGYVPGIIGGDGEELDCYILGVYEAVEEYNGICIAIVHRLNDNENKLIIVPKGINYTNQEINALIDFQERYFKHIIIRDDIVFNSLIPELSVNDINISKEFYKKLGFNVIYERLENKFCFIELENNQIMLDELNGTWDVGKLEYPYGNGINISMQIKDIDSFYFDLKSKGIKFYLDLETHDYRVNDIVYHDKEFLLQDPDGYLLRFNN